jgi:replication factor C large subunit
MSELFSDKYFPKNFDEFIGNVEIVEKALKWADNWNNGKEEKPLFFFGPPGIGKTALAYLIAKEKSWQIFEMNSSDLRNKDVIEKVVSSATGNASLFGTKRLILIDEIDSLQAVDRGGAAAINALLKVAKNPMILTANDLYSDKKLVPFRTSTTTLEFKKINYLSIAKRLREIADKEEIKYDEEAVKLLAKNSGGDFRSTLLDLQSLSPEIKIKEVEELYPRQRKEKIFPVMTKIFKGHNMWEIKDMADNAEVSNDLLMRWIEENIPRQYDEEDTAKAFSRLSRADIFQGRIFRRQHYSFLKYLYFLSTVGVSLARSKDYSGWKPFQFPTLLSSLSKSTSTRSLRKEISKKIGEKTHCSIRDGMQDIPFIQILMENKELTASLVNYFEFEDKEIAFLMNTKATTKKVQKVMEEAQQLEKQKIAKQVGNQTKLF